MDSTALVLCLFSLLCQAQGDVREENLYVKTGTDLLLDVGEPVTLKENEEMLWKFNSKVNIVKLTHTNEIVSFGIYKGRAELFPQNQSLLLKNVQKTDSGEYRVEVIGITNRVLAQYQVTVLDPVSDVKLEVKQCGSNWPDLALTCTTLDGLLSSTFICNETTCSHEGGEPTLKVSLKSGSVTCHHSNQVSFKEDTKTVEELCKKDPVSPALVAGIVFGIIVGVAVAAVAAAVIYYCYIKKGFILKRHVIPLQPIKDGGEITEKTRLQDSEGDPLQGPGPSVGAQSDPPDSIISMGTLTFDPIQPSGEANSIIIQMQEDLHKLLQPLHENEPLEPGPSNGAQGHMGPESWHFWTGEDVMLYFKKPAVLKDDVDLKVKVWKRSASLINRPNGQGTLPRGIRYIVRKASNPGRKNKENMTEK